MLWMTLTNDDTGNEQIGHYDVVVGINNRQLASCRLEDFNRADGWSSLISKAAAELEYSGSHSEVDADFTKLNEFLRRFSQ